MTPTWTVLKSSEDRSVNFILPMKEGSIETRYVRRSDDNFIIYLSSHTGCKHACRFCHLTTTNQTSFVPVTMDLYLEQALRVLAYYDAVMDDQGQAGLVHYNWMARGEALSNAHMIEDNREIIGCLRCLARQRGLQAKFNISTIIPLDFKHSLVSAFGGSPIEFYYSVYSMNEKFRKRWLPKAIPVMHGFEMLAEWQASENREIVLHWAFIAGENDDETDVNDICDAVERHHLKVRVNIVRYNPPNDKSIESAESIIDRNLAIIRRRLSDKSKIVQRVGFDAKASCGMFVDRDFFG
jgi:23S rRNA (adenine2503-C2)-methyltransferase